MVANVGIGACQENRHYERPRYCISAKVGQNDLLREESEQCGH